MHRIDSSGSVDGSFSSGNPATGQQATLITAEWLNDMQENIAHAIEQAGIGLVKGDETQLSDALVALIAGVVGDGGGAVSTTRQILAAGLASGGGDLTADRTITVPKASTAEVSAQVNDTKAVTPAALAGLVGLTVSGSAWIIKLGSVTLQIFTGTAFPNATTNQTLPIAFPNQCRAAFINGGESSISASSNAFVSGYGTSSVSVFSAHDDPITVTVLAIGN